MPPTRRPKSARETALALVGRRMLSRAELTQRLSRRGFAPEPIADAVELVQGYGYQADQEVAAATAREAARTLRGPRWVEHRLLQRGVAPALAAEAAARCAAQERALAAQAVAQRFGNPAELDDAERQRALAYLQRRGFSPACCLATLRSDELPLSPSET